MLAGSTLEDACGIVTDQRQGVESKSIGRTCSPGTFELTSLLNSSTSKDKFLTSLLCVVFLFSLRIVRRISCELSR